MSTRLNTVSCVTLLRAVYALPPTHCGVWRQIRVGWEKNSSSHRGTLQNKTKRKGKKKCSKTHSWNIINTVLNVWKENWKQLTLTAIIKRLGNNSR